MKVGKSEPVEVTETSVYSMESRGPGAVDRNMKTLQIAGPGDIEKGRCQCRLSAR